MSVSILNTAKGIGDNNTNNQVPSAGIGERYWVKVVAKEGAWANIPTTLTVAGTTDTVFDLITSNQSAVMKVAMYGVKETGIGTGISTANGSITYNADGDTPGSAAIVVACVVADGVNQTTPFTNTNNVGFSSDSSDNTEDCPFTLDEILDGLGIAFVSCSKTNTTWTLTDNGYAKNGDGQWVQGSNTSGNCATKLITSQSLGQLTTLLSGLSPQKTGTIGIMLLPSGGGGTPLIVQNLTQAQNIDQPALTQTNSLSANSINQSQTIDQPILTQQNILSTDDINQSQTIDSLILTQAHILSVNDITQSQTIDNITLSVAGALLVNNLSQTQTIDLASIIQSHILLVNGLDQSQSIDEPGLSIGITVDDINQAQTLDLASLTQANILSVDNLTQAQLLDNVYSGEIVVGSHKGEVLVFSAYNGIITSTNAHTGEVKVFNAVDIT